MKIATRILLPTLLLGATVALAQQTPAPAPAAAAPSVKTIDVSFRGTLRDALKRIAEDGGINVVATGELDTSVEVHLKGVTAQQALRTIARTYSLRLDEDGSIFTLRPMTAAEKESAEKGATASAAPSMPAPALPPAPPMAAMPPLPPVPPMPPQITPDDLDPSEIKERVREEVRKAHRRSRGARDVSVRGQSLEVKEGDTVDNAVVFGGNMVVKGRVEDDAVVFGGNLDIHGTVEGDATAFGGNVILHPGAAVEGSVASMGGTVIRNEGARVEGSTESFGGGNLGALVAGEVKNSLKKELRGPRKAAAEEQEEEEKDSGGGGLPGFILKFAALFGLGFLGQLFFPTRMKDLAAEIKARPFKSGVTGVLGLVALVPISVVLCITLIGIPVAGVLLLVAMLVTALGFAAAASELGMKVPVLRGRKTQAVVLALGLLILLIVGAIPGLGPLVIFLACMVGFGAAIRTRFGNRPPRGIPEPLNMPSSIGV